MEVLPLRKPFTVLIEPSSLCNFRCIQCFQSMRVDSYFTQNRGNMTMPCFHRVIQQLQDWPGPKIKVLKLSLYGEPLVNPSFCEMLRLAQDANIAERIETTTNASLLRGKIAEKLVEYKLDYLRVSIYASNQDRHRQITGSPMKLERIHENLRVLREIKKTRGSERPFVSCKMLDAYGPENDRFMELYQDVADELYLDKPHNWIKVDEADFINSYYRDEAASVITDIKEHATHRVACPMAFTTMAIRSNGEVSPCCVDYIGGTNLARADDGNLQAIWNSSAWYEFQKMQLEGRNHENFSCCRCDFYQNDHYMKDSIDRFDVNNLLKA